MKFKLYIFSILLSITLIGCVSSQEKPEKKKVANMKIGPEAMASLETAGAWLTYGSARSKYVTCDGYRYSFEEELSGRKAMAEFWKEQTAKNPSYSDQYLDTLVLVYNNGYIESYVWYYYFYDSKVSPPSTIDTAGFEKYRETNLQYHESKSLVTVGLSEGACSET